MGKRMSYHGIVDAILPVEPSEKQASAAVEQEATENDERISPNGHHRCRQVSCSEQHRRDHIGRDQNGRRYLFLISSKQLLQNKCDQGHQEQTQHHFFDDTAIGQRGDHIVEGGLYFIALPNRRYLVAEPKQVKQDQGAAGNDAHNGGRNQRLAIQCPLLPPQANLFRKNFTQQASNKAIQQAFRSVDHYDHFHTSHLLHNLLQHLR